MAISDPWETRSDRGHGCLSREHYSSSIGTYDMSETPGATNIEAGNGRGGDQAGHDQVHKRWGMHFEKGTNRTCWPAAERMTRKPKVRRK